MSEILDFPARNVLVFAGHDPCGGAGVQADIEAIHASGAFPLTILTALTAQNTATVAAVEAVDTRLIERQFALLLEDSKVAACKVGLIPTTAVGVVVAGLCARLVGVPTVVDPVLRSGSGVALGGPEIVDLYRKTLLRVATVVTPNVREAALLAESNADPVHAGAALCDLGADHVLITDGDAVTAGDSAACRHWLFHRGTLVRTFESRRLPAHYHGSGCTLSSAIAARLGQGQSVVEAVQTALRYTHATLVGSGTVGRAQRHPHRLFRYHGRGDA